MGNLKEIFLRAWTYAGFVEVNRKSQKRRYTRAKGQHPAILSEEIVKRYNEERMSRKNARRAVSKDGSLYSRLITCDVCGHRLKCDNNAQLVRCFRCNRSISFKKVRKAIDDELDRVTTGLLPLATVNEADEAETKQRLDALASKFKDIEDRVRRLHFAHEDGTLEYQFYKERVKRLQDQQKELAIQEQELKEQVYSAERRKERLDNIATFAHLGKKLLDEGSVKPANATLREYFEIRFTADKQIIVGWR